MYFKGGNPLSRFLVSKDPAREVYFKGKHSLSGPTWGISKTISKCSTIIRGNPLSRFLVSKGPKREVSFKGEQSLSGPALGLSVIYQSQY